MRGRITLAGRRYDVERDFGRLPTGMAPARVSQVAVDSEGHVHVLRRGDPPALVFTSDGAFVRAYGEGVIFDSHGISIDAQDRAWVVDRDAHQVIVFDMSGAPVLRLGERHEPRWAEPFNHPTRAAVAADKEIYVADGYGNARVHRFSREGQWIASFGEVGHGPGQFMTPHSVIVDRADRVLVCDRENDRVQVFDRTGGWLMDWRGLCRPMDLLERDDGVILVSDQVPSLTAFAPNGERLGRARPSLNGSHGVALAPDVAIYLAEIDPSSVTKLNPV
ncbi:MAG TPA: 6-bladed beta-propeller [Roseiarcus sp.]|jgi:peptidylglycine monooxygenase